MNDVQRSAMEQALEILERAGEELRWQAIGQVQRDLRAALAEPVQEPVAFMDAPERIYLQVCEDDHCEVPFHEHDEKTWCITKQNPLDVPYVRADLAAPPQRKPLTVTELQEALVYTNLIDRDAIDDPDNYDDGSTLAQIDELHRILGGMK